MPFYVMSGLAVDSEIDLPGLIGAGPSPAEVSIRRGRVPEALPAPEIEGPTWEVAGDTILLRIPGIVRFLLGSGRSIVFEPESDETLPDVPIFILSTAFGILLHQRQRIVLHASAVEVGGRAVLFCGRSGAGKSTLAAALSRRGYPLVTDDVCAVALGGDGTPLVYPDGRQLKLWAEAIGKLDLAPARGAPVRRKLQKFYVEPDATVTAPRPVGAVYVLREARPPHVPGIRQANVLDAAVMMRRNAYRPQLVRRLGQQSAYFRSVTAIAGAAGTFTLTRELNFAKIESSVDTLETHWRDLGLRDRAA